MERTCDKRANTTLLQAEGRTDGVSAPIEEAFAS